VEERSIFSSIDAEKKSGGLYYWVAKEGSSGGTNKSVEEREGLLKRHWCLQGLYSGCIESVLAPEMGPEFLLTPKMGSSFKKLKGGDPLVPRGGEEVGGVVAITICSCSKPVNNKPGPQSQEAGRKKKLPLLDKGGNIRGKGRGSKKGEGEGHVNIQLERVCMIKYQWRTTVGNNRGG